MLQILRQKISEYFLRRKAFAIGKHGGLGYNIYITFCSAKTVTKDSYRRYAMAMKHYNQEVCDKDYFIAGYKIGKLKKG